MLSSPYRYRLEQVIDYGNYIFPLILSLPLKEEYDFYVAKIEPDKIYIVL